MEVFLEFSFFFLELSSETKVGTKKRNFLVWNSALQSELELECEGNV